VSREEALGKANQLVADCINAKDRQAQEVIADTLESLYERIAELRRRIHYAEKHNQHFERCESAWCHPGPDRDPVMESLHWREARIAELERENARLKVKRIGFPLQDAEIDEDCR
jgi:hypothetical protein